MFTEDFKFKYPFAWIMMRNERTRLKIAQILTNLENQDHVPFCIRNNFEVRDRVKFAERYMIYEEGKSRIKESKVSKQIYT